MSGLISNLPNNVTRGITLNDKHIDLFAIIEDDSKSDNQKREEIIAYLEHCKSLEESGISRSNLVLMYVDYVDKKLGLGDDKDKLIRTIASNIDAVFSSEKFIDLLKENGFQEPENINNTLMEATDNVITRAKEGIAQFLVVGENGQLDENASFEKVKAFYTHVISGEYNRINFDDIASPGSYMAIQPDFVRPRKLQKAMDFCEKHSFSGKINSAFFYMHSHYPENPTLNTTEDLIQYYEAYCDSISEQIEGSNVETYDIFNEFVYRDQPQIVDGEVQYAQRHNGIHSRLNIEQICDIAKKFREKNPNLEFLYNDDGWEKQEKREGIFRTIEEIQGYEDYKGQLINSIGMQFHTSINIDISQIRKAVEECKARFPDLNIDITELDVVKNINGFDYETASKQEIEAAQRLSNFRQKQIMSEFKKLAEEGKISELTLWSQSDEMAFRKGESSLVGYDPQSNTYAGKEIEPTQSELQNYNNDLEIVSRNILLGLAQSLKTNNIEAFEKLLADGGYIPEIQNYYQKYKDEIMSVLEMHNAEPVQDFNLHTHTLRCGHADKFAEDIEYVQEAIKAGMKRIAFTDHVPFPEGQKDFGMRMDFAETDDYLASIEYLKQHYEGIIDVQSGFEFEYVPELEEHLRELKSKSDVMILGQHFVMDEQGEKIKIENGDKLNDEQLELYAQAVENAITSGIPDIIAHPDIFLRNSGKGNPEYQMTDKEREVTERICEAAAKGNVPLEINTAEIFRKGKRIKGKSPEEISAIIKTPSREFWKIAAEKGCRVLFGKDAHFPNQLSEDIDYEIAKGLLGTELYETLDFVTLEDLDKAKNQPKISMKDIESIALSTNITSLNQTMDFIRGSAKQKENEERALDD